MRERTAADARMYHHHHLRRPGLRFLSESARLSALAISLAVAITIAVTAVASKRTTKSLMLRVPNVLAERRGTKVCRIRGPDLRHVLRPPSNLSPSIAAPQRPAYVRRRRYVRVWDSTRDVSLEYWKGWMPACRMGNVEFVKAAIEFGVDVEQVDDEVEPGRGKGRTGLQEAAARGHYEVVELILEQCPNVNHQDYWNGRTALMDAAKGGHGDIVMLLINAGAATEIKDFDVGGNSTTKRLT
eukprot:CAMPEP_0114530952 /NCGR_PEP_ID=MMETSP0109-20121206/25751_1 /TAXON_ID=29199 /ORGANISM="Chlorarachnion reptans, Strain CCCM449" /LENGTH=241 /DNA_ID=CAMNT_0001713673 /DNA_START=80 /DNA_END=805 /DNA_ORIENTATION=+